MKFGESLNQKFALFSNFFFVRVELLGFIVFSSAILEA